jgi:hypothetical protein
MNNRYPKCISLQLCIFFFFSLSSLTSHAEGSRELNSSLTGYRVFLSYAIPNTITPPFYGFYAITQQDTLIAQSALYVYAIAGERICVASSALGVMPANPGLIRVYRPDGTLHTTFSSAGSNGEGFITPGTGSKARENAGPYNLHNGVYSTVVSTSYYLPHVVTAGVGETGVWRVEFTSPNPSTPNGQYHNSGKWPTGNTPNSMLLASNDFEQRRDNVLISAFDISIVNSSNQLVLGRVFSEFLQLSNSRARFNLGSGAGATTILPGNSFDMQALTRDGLRYRIRIKDLSGDGYFLYADNSGLQKIDGQTPAYQSVQYQGTPCGTCPTIPLTGFRIFNPFKEAENAFETRHKLFFNTPDASMPATATSRGATTWLYPTPVSASNITLNHTLDGVPNPLSGTFTFNFPNLGIRYKLKLDLNRNGTYGDPGDYIVSGVTASGANAAYWNGLDSAGIAADVTLCYNAKLEFLAGELHIPFADVEHFRGGVEITRLNGSLPLPNDSIFWNDVPLQDNNNITSPVPPLPYLLFSKATGATQGVSSSGGYARRWEKQEISPIPPGYTTNPTHVNTGTDYGDNRYIDQWTLDTLESKVLTPLLCYFPAPLKILSFTATKETNAIRINWKAELEENFPSIFLVQRSFNGVDFETLDTIYQVNNNTSYVYKDYSYKKGRNQYRIEAITIAKKVFSKVVAINIGWDASKQGFTLYPSPVTDNLQISFTKEMPVGSTIKIINTAGMIVVQKPVDGEAATMNVTTLATGIYIAELQYPDGTSYRSRFIKN